MIYRPTPIIEAKAQAIEERLRQKILTDRLAGGLVLPKDPGFVPAEGRLHAIHKRIAILRAMRIRLRKQLGLADDTLRLEESLVDVDGPVEFKMDPASVVDAPFEQEVIDPES